MAKKGRQSSWTKEDEDKLRDLWGTMKDAELAAVLGRHVSTIRQKATEMNLRAEKGQRAGAPSGSTTPWTKEEEMILYKNVGHFSIFELMEMLPNRTRAAIESRCRRLGFSPTQGAYTRCAIERETGYDWRQIKRARDALGQAWKRYAVRSYIISEDQVDEITEYLKWEKRKWAKHWNLDACRSCGTSGNSEKERHSGDGLCKAEWDARRYQRNMMVEAIVCGKTIELTESTWKSELKRLEEQHANGPRHSEARNRPGNDPDHGAASETGERHPGD